MFRLTCVLVVAVTSVNWACARADGESVRGSERVNNVPEVSEVDTTLAAQMSEAFRAAAHSALPAVVWISTERTAVKTQSVPEPLREFFGIPEGAELPPERGVGSGFILDRHGLVATNNHVVANASRLTVRLEDGREFTAQIVGTDPTTDVAVVRIQADDLHPAVRGNSDDLDVGDWVLALGNPLGLEFTVTAGIVGAKYRQLSAGGNTLQSFVQTDAAINPGNSGGPLIDLAGRVVGINTAISGTSFVGYGFAVPINLVSRVIDDLVRYGRVKRPRLGVGISDVTSADAEAYGLDQVAGAEIVTVDRESPAGRAGLRVGDVILALDGQPILNPTVLTTALAEHKPGDRVEITYFRDHARRRVTIELGEFPTETPTTEPEAPATTAGATLGFSVTRLTADVARQLGYNQTTGVIVDSVRPYSAAGDAGIRRGQLVTSINGRAVSRVQDVERIAAETKAGNVVSVRLIDPTVGETIVNYRTR